MSTNIKKLAEELKLSTATVSRALMDSYQISLETKEKVWAKAKELNYQPNPSASNLRSQKSKTIAVIIPEIANNFFSQAINGIEEIARQKQYHVLIYQSHDNSEIEAAFIKSLLSGRVDGILISIASGTKNIQYLKEVIKDIPLIFFDRVFEDIDAVKIITDDYESAYNATQHLIDCKCKKIAYLSALNNLCTGKRRLKGYKAALADNNIPFDDDLIAVDVQDEAGNLDVIKKMLTDQRPDGVISSIEEMALPCYYACAELNIQIPKDLKIISFSNLKTAALLNPSLTTITQPAFEIGSEAANNMFKILQKRQPDVNDTLVLKSNLIKRDSTAC